MRNSVKLMFVFCLIQSSNVAAQWYSHSFDVMGTQAKVEFEWSNQQQANLLLQQVEAEMNRVDRLMSPYKELSELSLLNREATKKPIPVSQEVFNLLKRANEFSELTHGAFDISFSSVGYLYDYRNSVKPSSEQIDALKGAINYHSIQLDSAHSTVFFSDKRVKIDLGGIGKGHAVDQCIKILEQAGIKNAYVNAGGDSRLLGRKENRLWYIGIKHPRDENKLLANLPLEQISISTSGDYERYFDQDGIRYHHIIDPKTGDSARAIRSATILAKDSTTADALSTSLFIMGVHDGMALINSMEGVSAIVVDAHGKLFVSKDLAAVE